MTTRIELVVADTRRQQQTLYSTANVQLLDRKTINAMLIKQRNKKARIKRQYQQAITELEDQFCEKYGKKRLKYTWEK